MNAWFEDPRTVRAEAEALEAEAAARRGESRLSAQLYASAGTDLLRVASEVPMTHRNTRSELLVSGLACLRSAGLLRELATWARRFLGERELLTEEAIQVAMACAGHGLGSRGSEVRHDVRASYQQPPLESAA